MDDLDRAALAALRARAKRAPHDPRRQAELEALFASIRRRQLQDHADGLAEKDRRS